MQTLISKSLMEEAIKLSSEWNNTCFFVINESGVPDVLVWQAFKYYEPRPDVIGHVNGNDGFVLNDKNYIFEVEPKELL